MNTYKPNIRILPFVFIAVFVILLIYDAGLEQEELAPEVISESLSINIQNDQNIQSRDIHIVEQGENLSLIFEKYKVSLNDTYKIFREDKTGEVKSIRPKDRLEFISSGDELSKIIINKGPLLSYEINLFPEIAIKKIEKKPELINSFKTGLSGHIGEIALQMPIKLFTFDSHLK